MRLPSSLLVSACLAGAPLANANAQGEPAPAQAPVAKAPAVYDEKADATAQVDRAIAQAKKENKRVLIQWGANWCGWCRLLHECMKKDAALAKTVAYEYEVVHVDVGRFDKNQDLVKRFGAAIKGIPYLTIVDGDGKAVVNQPTEPFETEAGGKQGHDPKKLDGFLVEHQTGRQQAAELRAQALARAKAEGKAVFLHFGAPWCGWCHRLEDWMERPEVAPLLAREFVDLKIDTDRMLGGKDALAGDRSAAGLEPEAGGIPWFLFLDAGGKQLATSESPKGNVGFPYEPHEVDHFMSMLEKASGRFTPAELQSLRESLAAARREIESQKAKRAGA